MTGPDASMIRTDSRQFLTVWLMLALMGLCALFLYGIGIDALEGRSNFQFFADSETYHAVARGDLSSVSGAGDLITVAGNLLGPVLLIRLLGENYYLIMMVLVTLLFVSVASIARSLKLDLLSLTLLLLVNPLTISSVISINKEIISLVFVALLLRVYTARSLVAFLCAVLVSLMVRWQLTLFLFTFAGCVSPLNPFRRNRWLTVLALLVGMSLIYVKIGPLLESVRDNVEQAAAEYEGSGLMSLATAIQDRGGYILVFPVKAAHLLFGMGLRFDRLFDPVDVYNDVWQLLHSTATLLVFIRLWYRKRLRIDNDLVYISLIYIVVFAISPVYSPRYFYPVFVLWVIALVAKEPTVRILRAPGLRPRAKAPAVDASLAPGAS